MLSSTFARGRPLEMALASADDHFAALRAQLGPDSSNLAVLVVDYINRLREAASNDPDRVVFDKKACDRLQLDAPRPVQEAVLFHAYHAGVAGNWYSCSLCCLCALCFDEESVGPSLGDTSADDECL